MSNPISIIMLGATGAVGHQTASTLIQLPTVKQLTLLGRRTADAIDGPMVSQHKVDVFSPSTYQALVAEHTCAICTFGVGQPSKVSKGEFIKVDKEAVLDFAKQCKEAGVKHFELLSSVGVNSASKSFYLSTKGQLEDELAALSFERLSLFHPSMIITPNNRYGFTQALTLAIMPKIDPFLKGSWHKYRSIPVESLGRAIANNAVKNTDFLGTEVLEWKDIIKLSE